jgi:hypothetical protein
MEDDRGMVKTAETNLADDVSAKAELASLRVTY